jgi:hypothetical protein
MIEGIGIVLNLIARDAEIKRVATGFGFTEGPVLQPPWFLLFSDIPNERIHIWERGEMKVFRERATRPTASSSITRAACCAEWRRAGDAYGEERRHHRAGRGRAEGAERPRLAPRRQRLFHRSPGGRVYQDHARAVGWAPPASRRWRA